MPAGWYDDPWSPGALRWWDGNQWTPHVAPRPYPAQYSGGGYGWTAPLTADEVAKAGAAGRRAAVALIVYAVATCAEYLLAATLLHSLFHDIRRQFDQLNNLGPGQSATINVGSPVTDILGIDVAALVGFGCEIFLIIWMFQSANVAEKLRLPRRRKPVWAILGFIVPIVNFWFPYQVAADLLPPTDPRRRVVGWWWAYWLIQGFLVIPLMILSFVSVPVAVVVAVVACALPVAAAIKGRQMIAAVCEQHAALASGQPRQ